MGKDFYISLNIILFVMVINQKANLVKGWL